MSVMSDVEKQVRERIKELEPAVAEHRQLLEILGTFERAASGKAPRRESSGRSRRSSGKRGSGRSEEALALITGSPGVSVAELAEQMNIGPTYLYRLLPKLEREGRLRKDGKGYHPAS